MSNGSEQSRRLPPLLGDQPFNVDEADFAQRIALAASLARRLRFVDLGGRDRADWGRFFEADEALVLARIAAVDIDLLQRMLARDLEAPLERLALRMVTLAQEIGRAHV